MKTRKPNQVSAKPDSTEKTPISRALAALRRLRAEQRDGTASLAKGGIPRPVRAQALLVVLIALASPLFSAHAQEWVGTGGNWSDESNWDTNTVPDGRDVTVVFSDNATATPVTNTNQAFTHLQVGDSAAVDIIGAARLLAPDDPLNPGFPSPIDPATISVGTNSTLALHVSPIVPFGSEPDLLSVEVGAASQFHLTGLGKFDITQVTKTGAGTFSLGNTNIASISVEEGSLATANNEFSVESYVGLITVSAGARLEGSGTQWDYFFSIGTSIFIEEDGNFLHPGGVNNYLAPLAQVSLDGNLNFRLGTLKDDDDGLAGIDWSLLDVTDGSVQFHENSLLTLNFSPSNNPDAGDPFWDSDHTWQIVDANTYNGTMDIQSPTYAAGTFSFDSGNGQLSFNAIPEPSAALFVLTGVGALLLKRRRKS